MWRISNDVWDIWHNDADYPKGLGDQFQNVAKWAGIPEPGHWPDADMLPVGRLGPAPGWGKPRDTRLSHDEQRTLLTLWSISRSPLMVGGDLSGADEWTTSLLTNPEVLAVDQHSTGARQLVATPELVLWSARAEAADSMYIALFNLTAKPLQVHQHWNDLGLSSNQHKVRDLWQRKDLGEMGRIETTLPAHGSILYKIDQ
jgi:hypothetical protein